MITLGIDVGGTGIKGAPVDTETGALTAERFRVITPNPSTPKAVAEAVKDIVTHFKWKDRIGCGFPSVVKDGVVWSAANIDQTWIGANGKELLEAKTQCKVNLINDADAAGLAEMAFGAGKKQTVGVVLMLTVGTGIGSALFVNGVLHPNTELGHIEVRGKDAEKRASDAIRQRKDLSWGKWTKRFDEYLNTLERLLYPDLFIIGGGGSKYFERFAPQLTVKARVVPAKMRNEAGIVGAALAGLPQVY
jgi:polyphosphate glucokinase